MPQGKKEAKKQQQRRNSSCADIFPKVFDESIDGGNNASDLIPSTMAATAPALPSSSSSSSHTREHAPDNNQQENKQKQHLNLHHRLHSMYEDYRHPRSYLATLPHQTQEILKMEDTDGNAQVTIDDDGPKHVRLPISDSAGFTRFSIRGNYRVSTLLQELALLWGDSRRAEGEADAPLMAVIERERIEENPANRLERMIREYFWPALIRKIDAEGLSKIAIDPKGHGIESKQNAAPQTNNQQQRQPIRIYVPSTDTRGLEYYESISQDPKHIHLNLQVIKLPPKWDADYVYSLNERPGILALDLGCVGGGKALEGKPFIVPGGRFNEMYGWDSYFSLLGILQSPKSNDNPAKKSAADIAAADPFDGAYSGGHPVGGEEEGIQDALQYKKTEWQWLKVAISIVDNQVYQIEHYGMILNANRSYYLLRSQPPFLTDMLWKVYDRMRACEENARDPLLFRKVIGVDNPSSWLCKGMQAAIKEYKTVWMASPRHDRQTNLSRYGGEGRGIPPETESSHFDSVLAPLALQAGVPTLSAFIRAFNEQEIEAPALQAYLRHDRAVRESGHDTSYRLDGRAADLATVDLCSLLYKYEVDIARFVAEHGQCENCHGDHRDGGCARETKKLIKSKGGGQDGSLCTGCFESHQTWLARANTRKQAADKYLWNPATGIYHDWNCDNHKQSDYESATTFWPLWSGLASERQADSIAQRVGLFEAAGGLTGGTEASRGLCTLDRPNRQWDYPFGWAPHQILAWQGLHNYGHTAVAKRLAYKWLWMLTRAFSDFNGVVPEKFNVVKMTHKLSVEYGNVGVDFECVPREGFAWMNASYLIGLGMMGLFERRCLGALVTPDALERIQRERAQTSQ